MNNSACYQVFHIPIIVSRRILAEIMVTDTAIPGKSLFVCLESFDIE
jgi:hypothetical protein